MTFLLPLGAAMTRRQRLGTTVAILLPETFRLFDWFVLNPDEFSPLWTTPSRLVVGTGGWLLFYVAVGGPLFLLGRHLASENGPFREAEGRVGVPKTG